MTKFNALFPLALIAMMESTIVGLPWSMTEHRSSGLEDGQLANVHRQARQVEDDEWGAFLDLGRDDPCWNYFKCLMPSADYSFLDQLVSFNMQEVLGNLSRICLGINEPSSCAVDDCQAVLYSGHWYTEALVDYRILHWSCEHVADFQAGLQCWAEPFSSRMNECLVINTVDPELGGCLAVVPMSIKACTDSHVHFLSDLYYHMLQVIIEVQDNIRRNYV